jgi:UDP-3-O-[3-hydroxymyristoyl] glucosamine N-acyltransferase
LKLKDIAARLECRLDGDPELEIRGIAALDDARPGELTFFTNPKYAASLRTTRASAVILGESVEPAPCAMLRARHPYLAFARAVEIFADPWRPPPVVHPTAAVGVDVSLGPDVSIGPFAVIGDGTRIGARSVVYAHAVIGREVEIGEDCLLHARVSIRERVRLGHRVIVQDGAVIGSDGFGFARRPDGTHHKIPQIGGVVIEDDVEIGANAAIDRPAVGETRIGAGTKIDNLVQVAHGVRIGRDVLLAAQTGIAGSTVLEDRVIMAGQSGATGHVRLGAGAIVGAKSAVTKDIRAGEHVAGVPAVDVAEWREAAVLLRRLPEMRRALAAIEARLAALEADLRSRA